MPKSPKAAQELLHAARPAIHAMRPDPVRRGYMVGFGEFFGPNDQENYRLKIESTAALYDLDHRWWPAHREAVITLLSIARGLVANSTLSYSKDPLYWTAITNADLDALEELLNRFDPKPLEAATPSDVPPTAL